MTEYAEAGASDVDIALYIANNPQCVNVLCLPVKIWAARQNSELVALLLLKTAPYISLDLFVVRPETHPFMRMFKLLHKAEEWLQNHAVPMVCIAIHNSNRHFQALVRRLGYAECGNEIDENGIENTTIYAKYFPVKDSVLH